MNLTGSYATSNQAMQRTALHFVSLLRLATISPCGDALSRAAADLESR